MTDSLSTRHTMWSGIIPASCHRHDAKRQRRIGTRRVVQIRTRWWRRVRPARRRHGLRRLHRFASQQGRDFGWRPPWASPALGVRLSWGDISSAEVSSGNWDAVGNRFRLGCVMADVTTALREPFVHRGYLANSGKACCQRSRTAPGSPSRGQSLRNVASFSHRWRYSTRIDSTSTILYARSRS